MPLDVAIRRAVPSDASRLHELVNTSYRGAGNWTHEAGLVGGPRLTQEQARELLATQAAAESRGELPASVVLVAEERGGLVVGCIEVTTSDVARSPVVDGYLGLLAVDARVGSQGVGRALVSAGEEGCVSVYGARAVVLYVLSVRKDIQAWYARRGYTDTGKRVPAAPLIEEISPDSRLLVPAEFMVMLRLLHEGGAVEAAPAQ
jgi:ribosomal protein S18 acetylase RimI-like enzyme